MSDVFRTPVDDARPHSSGWVRVGSVDVLAIPLIDTRIFDGQTWLTFARLSHNDLEQVAAREGARLVSMATLRECWEVGLRLRPVQLVRTQADTLLMRGKGFCDEHDRRVWEQLGAAGWEGGKVVANIGKNWLVNASADKGRNGGWFDVTGVPVQPGGPGSEHHDRDYTDYSQVGTLEKPVAFVSPDKPLGLRCLDALRAEMAAGVIEIPGAKHHPRILEYHAACRRNGKPLGLNADEAAWCASSQSFVMLQCALPGEPLPHDPVVSVSELIASAKDRGRFHDVSTGRIPEVGDLLCWKRGGQDPRKGGQGHVNRKSRHIDRNTCDAIGGNESGGRFVEAPRSLLSPDYVGSISYQQR